MFKDKIIFVNKSLIGSLDLKTLEPVTNQLPRDGAKQIFTIDN